MLGNLTGWHLLIILAIVLLVFGAAKLPALARSVGQSTRIFKQEMRAGDAADAPSNHVEPSAPVDSGMPATRTTSSTGDPVDSSLRH